MLAAGAMSLLAACSEDYLDRAPLSNVSDGEFWKSTSDLQLYCNNFYNTFPSYTGFGSLGIYSLDADQGSDNAVIGDGYNTAMNGERVIPASGGGWSWGTLKNVNYFMTHYQTVNASWDVVKPYVGEALFFRAQFYFGMMKTFGDLPWITKPIVDLNDPALFDARLSRKMITDSIIRDLDSAIAYLPSKSKQAASRVHKELAMLLQSRIALYEGTWEKYHAGTPFGVTGSDGSALLQKAATAAEAVMTSGVFSLDNTVPSETNYWSLFNQTDYSGSKEIMLWRQYKIGVIVHNWHRYSIGGSARGITKDLVDYYLCKDGQPIAVSPLYRGDDSIVRVVADRDPRLNQTVYVADGKHITTNNKPNGAAPTIFTVPQLTGGGTESNPTGYQIYKGHNPDYNQQYAAEVGTTALILFRYAEALLNFAEAKAELGTLTQADVDLTINKLRSRVGMPNLVIGAIVTDPNWEFPTLTPIINEVRRERRVELACEGFRRDDIYRWAAADELLVGWKPLGAKKNQFTTLVNATALAKYQVNADGYIEPYKIIANLSTGFKFNVNRDYLSPMPQDQLRLNTNLKPNPGW